jgi:hypothetical protein
VTPMTRTLLALALSAPLAAAAVPITLDEALALAASQSHDLGIARNWWPAPTGCWPGRGCCPGST